MDYTSRPEAFHMLRSYVLVTLLLTLIVTLIVAAIPASSQTPTNVYNFKGGTSDVGIPLPQGVIAQGRDGNLYSAAEYGGANRAGGIFTLISAGAENLIYSFSSSDMFCSPGVNLGNDGNFYGVCERGGDLG